MPVKGLVKKGEYYDSVTLMRVARKLGESQGIADSAVVMGTKENRSILKSAGLLLPEFEASQDADLLIVVKALDDKAAAEGLAHAEILLKETRKRGTDKKDFRPRSLEGALKVLPDADLAVVSVAGRYAGDVAMDCLKKGLHVMLFSDNVPLAREIELKKYAKANGLIVMGPDCGTAIINGIPIAFANAVSRGDIGIVAAAGTGLQEVSTLISNSGAGVSQAIGTGGRDVKKDVGGIAFLQGMEALAHDPATKVIVLVSKPPHPDVLAKISAEAKHIKKPVVTVFLGGHTVALLEQGLQAFTTLEEAALAAVALSKGVDPEEVLTGLKKREAGLKKLAEIVAGRMKKGQKYLRGLFSGGTFVAEAQIVLKPLVGDIHSNAPLSHDLKLKDSLESVANTVVDFGEDEFTVGRPHPMIDYSLRNKAILKEASDHSVAVVLLDVVIGYGSNPNPAADLVPTLREAFESAKKGKRQLSIVASVTGTDADPQNRSKVVAALKKTGAIVMSSNAEACRLAGHIVSSL